jgi:hypothetical protein
MFFTFFLCLLRLSVQVGDSDRDEIARSREERARAAEARIAAIRAAEVVARANEDQLPTSEHSAPPEVYVQVSRREKQAIFDAAKNGQTDVVRELIFSNADVNAKNEDNNDGMDTPLICAVRGRHAETVRFLVSAKANVNAVNREGYSALFLAVGSPYGYSPVFTRRGVPLKMLTHDVVDRISEVVNILVAAKADVNLGPQVNRFYEGITPLVNAVATDQLEVVRALLRAGADTEVRTATVDHFSQVIIERTALELALDPKSLSHHYFNMDRYPLRMGPSSAVKFDQKFLDIIDLLVEHGANTSKVSRYEIIKTSTEKMIRKAENNFLCFASFVRALPDENSDLLSVVQDTMKTM